MGTMNKVAIGKQTSGFMQTRRGTRPLRVETLLNKSIDPPDSLKELWIETPMESSEATNDFAEGLAHLEGEEFGAEPEPKIDPILSRIAKEGSAVLSEGKEPSWKKKRRMAEAIRRRVGVVQPPITDDAWMYEE